MISPNAAQMDICGTASIELADVSTAIDLMRVQSESLSSVSTNDPAPSVPSVPVAVAGQVGVSFNDVTT
jgi:hypothetical protein